MGWLLLKNEYHIWTGDVKSAWAVKYHHSTGQDRTGRKVVLPYTASKREIFSSSLNNSYVSVIPQWQFFPPPAAAAAAASRHHVVLGFALILGFGLVAARWVAPGV